jgi:nitrogen-specific signal transduction histidine kinase
MPARGRHPGGAAAAQLRESRPAGGRSPRHELNNPLTGILGNAKLLLLETRRGKLNLPQPALQRLETIAELAVRVRETVRHLSDRWETAGADVSGANGNEKDSPRWPLRS